MLLAAAAALGATGVSAAGCGSAATAPAAVGTPSPADTRAGTAARAELAWLAALPARGTGPRLVSGYFGGYGSGFDAHTWSVNGTFPGLTGCDYADLPSGGQPVIDTSCDTALRQYAADGGLVTVSVHGPNPSGAAFTTPMDPAQFTQLTQPDTAIGRTWDTQLTQIAAGLARLTDAGVPVLFRPLLEMNGQAFWWSGQSPAVFRQVWQRMFAYVDTALGASGHQVLWVWSPGCEATDGVGGDASNGISTTDYYPGGRYVDVIGADCYTNAPAGPATARTDDVPRTYQELSGLAENQGKPFAFAELGGNNGNDEADSAVDFAAWNDALHADYPLAAYFLAWNGQVGPTGTHNTNGSRLLTDPGVINQPVGLARVSAAAS
ncbi:glycoside hydrolase family 26 protein [Actinospica durhamensis]|nr:glycosyl hydrolase [Actinospica durhamensis]